MKAMIFDLDGTLLDTLQDLYEADNYALRCYGKPLKSLPEVRAFVGNGLVKLAERSLEKGAEDPDFKEVVRELREYYALHCKDHTRPYPGIMELLKTLREKGIRTAVVSNKPDERTRELCAVYFEGLLDLVQGSREDVRPKPYPDLVNIVLEKLGIKAEDAVYIGDSEVDLETARNAGIRCVAVSWGFRDKERLIQAGAEEIIDDPAQLENLICVKEIRSL